MRHRRFLSTCVALLTLVGVVIGRSPLPGCGSLILRLRLPNGETKRVNASPTDTVADVRARAAAAKSAPTDEAPLYLDAACSKLAEDGMDLVSLGLENGALLFCGGDRASVTRDTKAAESTKPNKSTTTPARAKDSSASIKPALEKEGLPERKAITSSSMKEAAATSETVASGSTIDTTKEKAGASKTTAKASLKKEKVTTPTKKTTSSATAKKPPTAFAPSARGRKLGKGVTRSFEDLSSERSAVKVVRQKAPNCTQLSLDAAASQQLAAYLATKPPTKTSGPGGTKSSSSSSASIEARPRRVALLYGTSRPDTSPKAAPGAQVVTVDAIWEPPQPNATPQQYDARSLCKAVELGSGSPPATASGSSSKGKSSSSSSSGGGGCPASKVAQGLGLQAVGWLFSHPPRGHFLAPSEVRLTARLRACVEKQHGKAAGASFVVVAVRDGTAPSDPKSPPKASPTAKSTAVPQGSSSSKSKASYKGSYADGADQGVSFEAYQLSNQCYAWLKDGTLLPTADAEDANESGKKVSEDDSLALRTSKAIWAEGQETWAVDTAHFAVPVPIVAHRGFLATRFPPANRPELRPSPSILRRAIFGEPPRRSKASQRGAVASSASTTPTDSRTILKRLADFHLLLYLHKRLPADLGPLLELIQRSASPKKLSTKKGGKMTSTSSDQDECLALPPYYLAILENLCEPTENNE